MVGVKDFQGKKSLYSLIIFWISIIFTTYAIILFFLNEIEVITLVGWIPLVLLFYFHWKDSRTTVYTIQEDQLICKNSSLEKKIHINRIFEIKKNKFPVFGPQISSASKGLLIKYNRFDEIFISPAEKETFIKELLKINPEITVTEA